MTNVVESSGHAETSVSLERLIESLPDPIVVVSLERAEIESSNEAARRFFDDDDPSLRSIIPDTWSDETLSRELSESVESRIPFEWYTDEEAGRWVRLEPALRVQPGIATFGIRDITEQRKLVERRERLRDTLARAERFQTAGRIAGAMAHDFNNLLSIILNNADLLGNNESLDELAQEDLAEIRAAASDASVLSRKLLLFGGRDLDKPAFIDVVESTKEVLDDLQTSHGRPVEFRSEIDGTASVWVHRGQWRAAISAVVDNAFEATPDGGEISFVVRSIELDADNVHNLPRGEYVCFDCSDDGEGMGRPVATRAFEPFFSTKESLGAGLGLSIAYNIATSFGGHVEIETMQGSGTTVTLLLPKHDDDASGELELGASDSSASQDATEATILVVEDEPGVLRAVQRILTAHGFNLLTATNGAEALEVIESYDGTIDLLLTDVVMPGMSGVQLAKKVMRRLDSIQVLYMSGYTESALSLDQLVAGKSDLILKPFTAADLLEVIDIHLNQ